MNEIYGRMNRLIKGIYSTLVLLILVIGITGFGGLNGTFGLPYPMVVHAEGTDDLNPDSVDLYFLKSVYAEKIGDIPSQYANSYQIDVTGVEGTASYRIVSGSSYATVSSDGLVQPKGTMWYKEGNYWATYEIPDAETKIEYSAGTAVIRVTCGTYTKDITFNVKSYSEIYVEERMNSILNEVITDGMTEYEKLNAITTWVGVNTDYSGYYQSYTDMLIFECGDCWASTNTILAMCDKLGIKAKSRRGNQDSGAGSGHRNVFAVCDGKYYIAEAGYSGTRPRAHSVYEEPYAFSVRGSTIYQYDGYDTDVVVPSEIKGKTITGFGNGNASVFVSQEINSLSLPASITTIGEGALTGATGEYEIKVAEDSESFTVEGGILYDKDKTNLIIASPKAADIKIPDTVMTIGKAAICDFTLDELVIPSSVRTLGVNSFYNTTIGKLTIENGIETIGNSAFNRCKVDEIILPESVKTLEQAALRGCTASKIVLSPNITEIPDSAFYNTNVNTVMLHEGITSIGAFAFGYCYNLKSVCIPKTVTSIGKEIFTSSSNIIDIYYNGSKEDWSNITFVDTLPETVKIWYDDTVRVTGLTAADTDIKLTDKGQTKELSFTVLPANASNKEVTFTSSDTSVAGVTDNVVTAYGEGTCTITAVTNDGGYKVLFDVEVKYTRYKVNLDGATFGSGTCKGLTSGEFLKGDQVYIVADSAYGMSFDKWEYDGSFTYYTGDDTFPYITIYISDTDINLKAVKSEIKITNLSLGGNNLSVCKGESIKMSPYIVPTNVYNNTLSWSSNDESIATVDEKGNVTGHGTGYAVITAKTTDGSDISATKRVEVIEHVWNLKETVKEAACTEKGIKTYKCIRCETEKTEETNALGHNYKEAEITSEATCEETGEKTYTCSRCGDVKSEIISALGHETVIDEEIPATCTESGLSQGSHCSRCNKVINEQLTTAALGHRISKVIQTQLLTCTEKGEWKYTCGRCGYEWTKEEPALGHNLTVLIGSEPTCEKDGRTDGSYCLRCQETVVAQTVIPALGHDYDEGVVKTNPTCTTTGEKVYTCLRCEKTRKEVIPALGHDVKVLDAVDATCTKNGLMEGSYCNRCNSVLEEQQIIPATGHKYGEACVISEADCTEKGKQEYTCLVCGDKKEEEIPALGHDVIVDEGVAPTCETPGNIQGSHCGRCGVVLSETGEVAALLHNYDKGVIKVSATCEAAGLKIFTCTRCNKEKEEIIPAYGHEEVEDKAVEATCVTTGLTKGSHCKLCNKVFVEQVVVPALSHDYNEGTVTCESGCEVYGERVYSCNRCGAIKSELIAPLGHDEERDEGKAPTCENAGLSEGTHCSRCGKIISKQNIIPAVGHDFIEQSVVKAPTCTEAGESTFICRICNAVTTELVNSTGHKWDDGDITKGPTCTEKGAITYTCTVCHDINTEIINELGHRIVDDPAIAATKTRTGLTAGSHCDRCNAVIVEQKVIPKLVSDDPDKDGDAGDNGNDSDKSDKSDEGSGGSGSSDNDDKDDGDLDDSGKEQAIKGVGIISEDGKTLTDNSGEVYLIAENIEQEDIAKNIKVADEDTGGKYIITKVTVKSGKAVGGTVEYTGAYKENSTKVTVPAAVYIAEKSFKVTSVRKNTFANKKDITSVVIGKNVTKIGVGAFKGCKKLKSITVKSSKISSMGKNAFKGINSKAVFKVPKSKLTKYKKMIKKAGAPNKSKVKKS